MKSRILVSLAIVAVILIAAVCEGAQRNLAGKYDQPLSKGEARATLDPGMFREPDISRA